MKYIAYIVIGLITLLLITGFAVQTTPTAPDNTRIIIDHTKKVYASPPCFDQAELTNFLEETTLAHAKAIGYEPESACTSDSLVAESRPVIFQILGMKLPAWGKYGQW
ncbi:hypothetical protein [Bacillus sp. FJAT-45350]|uniref:hypothetical protein n=1 Tax=Bacillus sp. FJAT-45350 TaxID=2011014 RepID=UPI000BB96F1D|nr:hypothetical protein [Bacillus sp. FJAT-45350]